MTQNKIPTNEEILDKFKAGMKDLGVQIQNISGLPRLIRHEALELIEIARAAGREEQRIRDAERVKKRASELKASQEFYFEACELERQAEAIRAQGEGEK